MIDKLVEYLAQRFSFKALLNIVCTLMFIAGMFFGATLERLF